MLNQIVGPVLTTCWLSAIVMEAVSTQGPRFFGGEEQWERYSLLATIWTALNLVGFMFAYSFPIVQLANHQVVLGVLMWLTGGVATAYHMAHDRKSEAYKRWRAVQNDPVERARLVDLKRQNTDLWDQRRIAAEERYWEARADLRTRAKREHLSRAERRVALRELEDERRAARAAAWREFQRRRQEYADLGR